MGRAKPGPKPIAGIARQPNGQPSRAKDAKKDREDQERETVVQARIRVYGLKHGQAHSQMAGYPIGRLCLRGEDGLTFRQHDAALAFAQLRHRYLVAINAAPPIASPPASDLVTGETFAWVLDVEEGEAVKRNAAVRSRYADARSAVIDGCGADEFKAFVRVACHEEEPRDRADVLAIARCANVLMRLWRMNEQRAA